MIISTGKINKIKYYKNAKGFKIEVKLGAYKERLSRNIYYI